MNNKLKAVIAVFLNFSLITNQLLADLPPISFEATEWVPYQTVGQGSQLGWELNSGIAQTSAVGEGVGGGKALKIPPNTTQESRISRSIVWDVADKTAFIDLQVKPAADPVGSLASFYANGTQLAFQIPNGSSTGEIWVYHGDEGLNDPAAPTQQWIKTAGSFTVLPGATAATDYIRVTLRHDYQRNLWDLFINRKMVAANLAFEGRGPNLSSLEFYGSTIGATLIDDLSTQSTNMLFPDADKDGLPDAWEIANGSNPNLYDRDATKPGTSGSFLDAYMASLWASGSVNAAGSIPTSQGIPPLTIDVEAPHSPVTSLKGSLSVGGDGSANYSLPIDLPKGTGGMEPKLSLNYSSSGGNGMLGMGWSLGGLQRIVRGPASAAKPWDFNNDGPYNANWSGGATSPIPPEGNYDPADFDQNDRYFLDGELLICISGVYGAPASEYRTERDSYARITAIGTGVAGTGPISWKIETKAGLVVSLGATEDSKNSVTQGTLSWGVNQVADTLGNYYSIEYNRDSAAAPFNFVNDRISAIRYTGNTNTQMPPFCSVEFSYENRPDSSRSFTKFAGYRVDKRLSKIKVLTGNYINYSYQLNYNNSYQSGRSFLTSIQKLQQDNPTPYIAPTLFEYDGLLSSEAIWKDPGETSLPVYGSGLDATGSVNSMVSTTDNDTQIDISGDVARAYQLPNGGANLTGTTMLQFEFKSSQLNSGAIIGLDTNISAGTYRTETTNGGRGFIYTNYVETSPAALFRIGGTGLIALSSNINFSGPTQPYAITSPATWQTYTLDIGSFVRTNKVPGGINPYLVLMSVDNDNSDGISNASFRNIKIYQTGVTPIAELNPIVFATTTELPQLSDASGRDLGVTTLDLNGDGLIDLSDWRVTNYTSLNGSLVANTVGNVFMNTGKGFVNSDALRPPSSLPLGCRSNDSQASAFAKKFHLLGQPCDIDGDGNLDLMGAVDTAFSGSVTNNRYTFYTLSTSGWVEKTAWKLPFAISNLPSSVNNGGTERDEHFVITDINADGYPDLLVHTTAKGKVSILDGSNTLIGADKDIVFRNKGKNGPGWIADFNYALPVSLNENQKDVGRRLVDLDGDGVPEITESTNYDLSNTTRRTYMMDHRFGQYLWNSMPLVPPPSYPFTYDLPLPLTYGSNNLDAGLLMLDLNGDGLVDLIDGVKKGNQTFFPTSYINQGLGYATWANEISAALINDDQKNTYEFPTILAELTGGGARYLGYEITDLNGDGLPDFLYSNPETTATPCVDNLAILNTGNGWLKREEWKTPSNNLIYKNSQPSHGKMIRLAGG